MTVKARAQTIHEKLGPAFYDQVSPAVFPQHILRYRNDEALARIGLGGLDDREFVKHFGEFVPIPGSLKTPLALRYHGHQFGVYNPEIGDGRGFLFAQFTEAGTGRLLDLGTKGSGRTAYARTADGRLTLKGAVREVLATEMLAALNVPVSASLSVIETGEALIRSDEPSPTRSAVLVRLLHSHIRIGSFQRLAYLRQAENTEKLLRHVLRFYFSDIDPNAPMDEVIPPFLSVFTRRVAHMVAAWMVAGFVHGVMNTDNFNITGESFDFGPWRFLPHLDTGFTAAYFDQTGRYAFGRQPEAALWALCRLADCFIDYLDSEILGEALSDFYPQLESEIARLALWRLGLSPAPDKQAQAFAACLFRAAGESKIGWDLLFRDAYGGHIDPPAASPLWGRNTALAELREVLETLPARAAAPAALAAVKSAPLVTLEISVVEQLWSEIDTRDNWQPLYDYIELIRAHGRALRAGQQA